MGEKKPQHPPLQTAKHRELSEPRLFRRHTGVTQKEIVYAVSASAPKQQGIPNNSALHPSPHPLQSP